MGPGACFRGQWHSWASLEGPALILSSMYHINLTPYLLKERSSEHSGFLAGDSYHYQDMTHAYQPVGPHL